MNESAARELLEAIYQFVMERQAVELAGGDASYSSPGIEAAVSTVAGILSGEPAS